MKSSAVVLPEASNRARLWRQKSLWAVAVALALFGAAFVSGVSWDSAVQFAPYLLILACPAMHLFMCRSHKRDAGHSDAPTK